MHANGGALDLIAKAIEDLLSSSSLLDATNSGSDGRACRTLGATSGGSTCGHVGSSTCSHHLSLFLFFLLNAHAWDSGARRASLSIGSTVVAVATAEAE